MKRLLALVTAILLPTVVVAVLALSNPEVGQPGLPNQVTLAVDDYLNYHSQRTQTIQQIIPAAQPGHFTRQMSRATFGHSNYFQADSLPLPSRTPAAAWLPGSGTPQPMNDTLDDEIRLNPFYYKPLPFPPTALWCVLLQPTDGVSPRLVYIAQHEDDYSTVWVVHEPAAGLAQDLETALSTVGCTTGQTP